MRFNYDKLRELRIKKGYTQEKLAELLGVSRTYVNHLENGRRKPSINLVERLANEFNCSAKSFFYSNR